MLRRFLFATAGSALLVGPAFAGVTPNDSNTEFVKLNDATVFTNFSDTLWNSGDEYDAIAGDFDNDGWLDIAVVVKEDFTSTGKRRNVLLMNNGDGTFSNQTTQYATASDVPGDNGFNTPTNDRDVVAPDVDNDGWLDLVTAVTISDGDPKHIGHPRVYHNLGASGSNWLGFRYEDARFPQMFHFGTGAPLNARFCSVDHADLTGNGYQDLYFGDYDSSGAGGSIQPGNTDMNDRLFINDGNGFYSDQSQTRMTSQMLQSAFGMAVSLEDYNNDGYVDVMKDTALMSPQYVAISYNNVNGPPANEGFFNSFQNFHQFAPYHINTGDLNQDNRIDVIISDDAQDRWRLNLSNTAFGQVNWGSANTFQFDPGESDDGFASNNLIADLNGDDWPEALICDVDVDIGGYARRFHLYTNLGGTQGFNPGSTNFGMREENGGSSQSLWRGSPGFTESLMLGAHDVLAEDIDNDGDLDVILWTQGDMDIFQNQLDPTPVTVCQPDMGLGSGLTLSVCGQGLATGQTSTLELTGANPFETALLFGALSWNPVSVYELGGAQIGPIPPLFVLALPTNAAGQHQIPVPGGSGPLNFYVQEAGTVSKKTSNGIRMEFQP